MSNIDPNKCIICQKRRNTKVSSTETGRRKIIEAADIRRDDVYHRLNLLTKDDTFFYHMNNCYKNYTYKKTVDCIKAISDKNINVGITCIENNVSVTVQSSSEQSEERKSKRISNTFIKNDVCIFCDQTKKKNDNILHEIKEIARADQLFKATRLLKDDVYFKTAHLNDSQSFCIAKLKYHKGCISDYDYKYEKLTKCENVKENSEKIDAENAVNSSSFEISNCVIDIISSIESRFYLGEVFSINDLSKLITDKYGMDFQVINKKIKSYLIDYFEEKVCFIYSKEKNRSQLFYYSKINIIEDKYNNNCISECAGILRDSLNLVNFDLEDKFCDENDVKESLEKMKIPKPFLEFLSKLFNVKEDELAANVNLEANEISSGKNLKLLRIQSLFQIIYFILKNGLKKTPQHILTALFVYTATKSKNIITILNHLGLSISYDEVLRIRVRLAAFAIQNSQNDVPLPSHFNVNSYTTAAFDNFDHNEATHSGLHSTHDTVVVLFQNSDNSNKLLKPNISSTAIDKRLRAFDTTLKCQQIINYNKKSTPILLTNIYESSSISTPDFYNNLNMLDFIWFLSRMEICTDKLNLLEIPANQQTPAWTPFNSGVIKDDRCKQIVGYLPILPSPVTEYSTVYTCLINFKILLGQLDQEFLAVTCDEGVYRIARSIIFENEKQFEKIILCLGSFHMIKVTLSCIGKYLTNSGVEHIFIETGLFGIHVTEQLLLGTNYARSVKAFNYLAEALRRLQLKEFFTKEKLKQYEEQVTKITLLQESIACTDLTDCQRIINALENNCAELLIDFNEFILLRCKESETFRYWNNVLILISLMHDQIRADRTGDWGLHIRTVQKLQPVFHIMDRVNYARWSAVYIEDMLQLEKTTPEVYQQFLKGRFTVKRTDVPGTSVATDQALEQTINRSSKTSGGIIGSTRKKESIAIWDLTAHELLALSNFLKNLTHLQNDDDELHLHREFSNSTTKQSEEAVDQILKFFSEKKINLFLSGSQPLRNIVTEEMVDENVREKLLNIFENGLEVYMKFQEERFIKKTKLLSAPIPRNNLPNFKTIRTVNDPAIKGKKKQSTINETQRIIAIANERNYPLQKLLTYELTYKNPLFDEEGLLKKEQNKSQLIRLLEKTEDQIILTIDSNRETCLIVDVMLVLRTITPKNNKTFKNFIDNFSSIVLQKAASMNTKRIDLVFDSYFEKSIKSSEHQRRSKTGSIIYNDINERIQLPKQMDTFWSSSQNKILLQKFLQQCVRNDVAFSEYEIICSSMNDVPASSNKSNLNNSELIIQCSHIEEADVKIVVHVNHSVKKGYTNVYVISSDTDVIVLLLYFFKTFQENGLQTLWVRAGIGKSLRNIPIHLLAITHQHLCPVLPALHHLTGADYTSKVGTKLKALQEKPQKYLLHFAQDYSELNIDKDIENAEQFLVNVVNKSANCKTFDELRLWTFHSKCSLIEELPPTSNSIKLHILRAYYVVHSQITCLNTPTYKLQATDFGFVEEDDLLMPKKVDTLLPPFDEFIPNCSCKVCLRKTCICVAAEISCCSFCYCSRHQTCKNIYNQKEH